MLDKSTNMDNLHYMYELAYRANIDVYTIRIGGIEKYIVLYEDHRTILNVLYFARMKGILSTIPNIIYFDYHDDACEVCGDEIEKIKVLPISEDNFQTFWQFVEFSLGNLDDDWVWAAMCIDLIKNAVRVGGVQDYNIARLNEVFNKQEKHLYTINHFDEELDRRGCFKDSFSSHAEEDQHIRSIFGLNWQGEQNVEQGTPYILDFDLDCFTGKIDEKVMAWPEMIFRKHFEEHFEAKQLLRRLIKDSAFITICKESKCCGGIGESNKILSYLDHYFFDDQLQTLPII